MARVILGGEYAPAVRPDWTPVKPDFDTIPEELRGLPWAVFVLEPRPNGKWGKAPRNAQGFPVSRHAPEKWLTPEECKRHVEAGLFDGAGVWLDGSSDLIGIDFDTLSEQPEIIHRLLQRAIDEGLFCGLTVSGTGARIFCRGRMEATGHNVNGVEIYRDGRYLSYPKGEGEIREAQWLIDATLEHIGKAGAQGGQEKPAASPNPGKVEATPATLDRIERAVRAILGAEVERMRGRYSSDFGDSGTDDPSGQVYKVACCVGRKGLEAGVMADEDALTGVIHEVTGRFPVTDEWVDASGSKWDRLGETTARKAARAVLKEWKGPKPGQADAGNDGEEWPDPEIINFDKPPVLPFVTKLMVPGCIAGFIDDHAELMGAPPEALAMPTVTALAAAVGNALGIAPKRHDLTWVVYLNFWGYMVADPGRMKSEIINRGMSLLKQLERELDACNRAKRDEYEVAKVRYEVELAEFKKLVKSGATGVVVPQPPEEPKPERMIANDSTVAKLGEICAASRRGITVIRDEITGLLSQLRAPGHEGDCEFYLESWNVSDFKVDRIGRGSLEIPQLTLSLYGGIQPGKLNQYVRETTKGGAGADGLLPRFQLAIYPDYSPTFRNVDRLPNLEAQEEAFNAARRLFAINPTAIGAKTILGTERHYLQFNSEAQDLFDKWREGLENSLRKGDLHPALESHFAKFRSLIPKLALLFHLLEDGTGPVTIDALTMAIRWGNFLKAHARRIYAGAVYGTELATKALADKVKGGKVANPFKVRDIYRAGWAGLSDRTDVEPAIEGLLDAGWLREEVIRGTGRTTTRYWINPKLSGKPA